MVTLKNSKYARIRKISSMPYLLFLLFTPLSHLYCAGQQVMSPLIFVQFCHQIVRYMYRVEHSEYISHWGLLGEMMASWYIW